MSKQPLQDIVMPSQRKAQTNNTPPKKPKDMGMKGSAPRKRGGSNLGMWAIAIVGVLVLSLALSIIFSGATVSVTPKQEKIFIDGTFTAVSEGTGLVYDVITVEDTASKVVPATEEEEVEERASGTIVVYNNFDEASQRLIKNTRFETPDGLIYRIRDSIIVPGQKVIDGTLTPGSIEVRVYADEPGEEYNIGLTDFTIPGFKGSPRFEGFYARSASAMAGGFIGTRLAVSEEVQESTRTELQDSLRLSLIEKAKAQLPEGFVFYESGASVVYEALPNEDGKNETEVRERGILYGILFKNDELAASLARDTLASYDALPVGLENPNELEVSFEESENRLWEDAEIYLEISGTAHIVWDFDALELKRDLAGHAKSGLSDILSRYPGIERAKASVRPFWQTSFPGDQDKIKIERILE